MTDIAGRRAVITGAANGIGRILAYELAQAGASVVLWDIDARGLERVRDGLEVEGFQADVYVCDLASRDQIASAAAQTLATSGPVDILINNAGIVAGNELLDLTDEQIERTFAVNTMALFWTVRAFLPSMMERNRGHIVTVASAAGLAGTARLTDYCSSKFGAVGFDESLRMELRQSGSAVVTTVVCPYYTGTSMFAGASTRFSWLLPILQPDYVARRIVAAIRRNQRRLIMPRFIYSVFLNRLLPVSWFDALMVFFGVSHSLDAFHGGGQRDSQD
jgi:all-trans-retinol dehydrogenase (NAD+)